MNAVINISNCKYRFELLDRIDIKNLWLHKRNKLYLYRLLKNTCKY